MPDTKKNMFIANLLKSYREKSGFTVSDVIAELEKRDISIAEKTLYGYERGTSVPHVKVFIALCDIYHVSDILGSFGYKNQYDACISAEIMTKEEKRLIQRYRRISDQKDLDIIENILNRYDVNASSSIPSKSEKPANRVICVDFQKHK